MAIIFKIPLMCYCFKSGGFSQGKAVLYKLARLSIKDLLTHGQVKHLITIRIKW